jgi:Zn-finger nucleic acid-binding protein
MNCPHDRTPLESRDYEASIQVDECSSCGGRFLDQGELSKIQETVERDYSDRLKNLPDLVGSAHAAALASSKPPIECPKCSVAMERREHGYTSQILVDVCPQCRGVWLDRGELEALEVFFERVQRELTPEDEVLGKLSARLRYFWTLRETFGGIT